METRSKIFQYQKWTLLSLTSMLIMSCILISAISELNSLIGLSIIVAIISVLGLIGAYQEHFWYTLIYGAFMLSNTIASLYLASKYSAFWLSVVINFSVSVIAFCFARSIHTEGTNTEVVYVTN